MPLQYDGERSVPPVWETMKEGSTLPSFVGEMAPRAKFAAGRQGHEAAKRRDLLRKNRLLAALVGLAALVSVFARVSAAIA